MVEMKRMGLAAIDHHPVINEADRSKLYMSMFMNLEGLLGIANKVQFDIRLYFFPRGMEDMEKMRKTDLTVHMDPKTLQKYVMKTTDELTKNHRENDKENYLGVMPESPGSTYCPVASFERYVSKLHPLNATDRLWQRPLDSFLNESGVWYRYSPIESKTLSSSVAQLSNDCQLSHPYTNHSIRATGALVFFPKTCMEPLKSWPSLDINLYNPLQGIRGYGTDPT